MTAAPTGAVWSAMTLPSSAWKESIMTRIAKIALLALAATAPAALFTYAGPRMPALQQSRGSDILLVASAYYPREAIENWNGEDFSIYQISWFNEFDAQRAMMWNWISTNPDEVAALQASIRRNRALAAALRARNVQLNNVAVVTQAFSGELTFYLR